MSAVNFGSGFIDGFNTADRHAARVRSQDLEEARLDEAKKRSNQRQAIALENLDLRRDSLESQKGYQDQSLAIQEGRAQSEQKWRDHQMGRQNSADGNQAEETKLAKLRELAQAEMIKVTNGGQPDPMIQTEIAEGGLQHLTVDFWLQDDNVKRNLAGQRVLSQLQENGDFSAVNQPETLGLLHEIYRDQIERGIGEVSATNGKKIVGKQLASFNLAPADSTPDGTQGVVTTVRVSYEDGSTEDHPITLGRSSNRQDPVALNDVGAMLDDLSGRVKMAEVFSDKQFRQSISHLMPSAKTNGKDSTTDIKNVQFLVNNGMSFDSAKNTVFMAKNNPNQAIATLAGDILDNNLFAEEGEKYTPEDAYAKAREIVMANLVGTGGSEGGAPSDQGGSDPEFEKMFKKLRDDPKNRKYSDDQLRQALRNRMKGG